MLRDRVRRQRRTPEPGGEVVGVVVVAEQGRQQLGGQAEALCRKFGDNTA